MQIFDIGAHITLNFKKQNINSFFKQEILIKILITPITSHK